AALPRSAAALDGTARSGRTGRSGPSNRRAVPTSPGPCRARDDLLGREEQPRDSAHTAPQRRAREGRGRGTLLRMTLETMAAVLDPRELSIGRRGVAEGLRRPGSAPALGPLV